ncbi:DUF4380 domain-containing protein [Persicobacter diffluens]|uniref:DUF4380 domain-containing protein n=1 Tax=Persicobacter diffluens TaxID=981 RepID=UPI0030C74EA4
MWGIIPFFNNNIKKRVIESGTIRIEIDGNFGGRVNQIFFKDRPLLFSSKEHEEYYGSIWWPSPQRDWHWPPPACIDKNPYRVAIGEDKVSMHSVPVQGSDLKLHKQIQIINDHKIRFIYTATNIGQQHKQFGHWEVTRLFKGGRLIFPAGKPFEQSAYGKLPGTLFFTHGDATAKLINEKEYCFDIPIQTTNKSIPYTEKTKLLADAREGWAAYLNEGILLIKHFGNTPLEEIAPEQGEVELFVNPELDFIEFEQHGAYQLVKPQESSIWTVDWYIYQYPENLPDSTHNIREFIYSKVNLLSQNLD